ncbi:hypothetical protein WESB_2296 [Brachyspira pilosicoli WesB]|uniref:DUF1850 domain-containing protein n=1 Tax=Brachyspira pilosicoli WesB TaxID=1161918 RepID=K0JHP6_BRAPL|nr:DUF1850 domain-containing protein [Brachyspira pilosicoli]CCG57758.1 hypothetical protein WESB_2296 [Brachyspira pilosicoli WesB]
MNKIIILLLSLLLFITILIIPIFPRLVLKSVKDNNKYIYHLEKKEFIISYTHSVNKGRVRDYYIIDENGNIILDKTTFVSYGAGIAEPENNENIIIKDDNIEINNINRIIKDFYLFVGIIAEHSITIDDNKIMLKSLFKPQTNINIKYRNVSLIELIKNMIRGRK